LLARSANSARVEKAGQDVLGAVHVLAHEPHGAAHVAPPEQRHQAAVLIVRARENLLRVGDPGDQVAHLALHLRHRGHQARRVRRLRDADVEAHVGATVVVEAPGPLHAVGEVEQALEVALLRPLGGEHGRAGLDGHAIVEHRPRLVAEHLAGHLLAERRLLGDERPAGATPQ
jgi:hypothetical protein